MQFGDTCHDVKCRLKSSTGISGTRKRKQTEFFAPADEAPAPVVYEEEQQWDELTLFRAIFDALDEPIPVPSVFVSEPLVPPSLEQMLSDALEDMLPEPIPEALEPDLAEERPPSPNLDVDACVEGVKAMRQASLTDVLFDILVGA